MQDAFIKHQRGFSVARVFESLEKLTGISRKQVCGKERTQHIFLARAAAVLAMRANGMSYGEIGKTINRDHTSVINAERRGTQQMQRNNTYAELVKNLLGDKEQ